MVQESVGEQQAERGPWESESSPEKSEEDGCPERREREEGEDGPWRSALHIGDSQTNGRTRATSLDVGRDRKNEVEAAVVCCGMTSKQRFHASRKRQDLPAKVPQHPVNGTCIAGEVVAQCGRRGILVVRLAGAQGSWPGSAWTTKLHLGTGLNVLAGTWRGDSCPTDTHKTSTTTSSTWLHLVFRRGGQDRVEINGLSVPPASSPSIERRLTVVYPQRPKNLRVAGKTGKRLDALTALPSGGRGRRDWVPFRTRVPSRMLSVPSPRNLVASKLPGSVAESVQYAAAALWTAEPHI